MQTPDFLKLQRSTSSADAGDGAQTDAPLGGTRAEATQRLQVGLSGIGAMILLVGLANIIQDRARVTQEASVPDAAPTTAPVEPPPQRDPLADAGVVPDLPVEQPTVPDVDPLLDIEQTDVEESPQS